MAWVSPVLLIGTHPLPGGLGVRLRLPHGGDHAPLAGLLERLGLAAPELERRRMVALDPRHRMTVCATAWTRGGDLLVGYAAGRRDAAAEPDVLLADEAAAPGVTGLLRAALAEQGPGARVA
jgi:hypothetical protein